MNTIERVLTLKSVEMFGSTPEEILADIAAILDELHHKPGEVIFEKGQVGDSMYIIIEGKVRVYDGERTIAQLGERDIFGELALLDPEPRFASIGGRNADALVPPGPRGLPRADGRQHRDRTRRAQRAVQATPRVGQDRGSLPLEPFQRGRACKCRTDPRYAEQAIRAGTARP